MRLRVMAVFAAGCLAASAAWARGSRSSLGPVSTPRLKQPSARSVSPSAIQPAKLQVVRTAGTQTLVAQRSCLKQPSQRGILAPSRWPHVTAPTIDSVRQQP